MENEMGNIYNEDPSFARNEAPALKTRDQSVSNRHGSTADLVQL